MKNMALKVSAACTSAILIYTTAGAAIADDTGIASRAELQGAFERAQKGLAAARTAYDKSPNGETKAALEQARRALVEETNKRAAAAEIQAAKSKAQAAADVAAAQQAQDDAALAATGGSSPASSASTTFKDFSATIANKSILATANIANLFADRCWPWSCTKDDPGNEPRMAFGFTFSSSLPVSNASFSDYATAELLRTDGGIVNVYWTPFLYYDPAAVPAARSGKVVGQRAYAADRIYIGQPLSSSNMLTYVVNAIGAKAINKSLTSGNSPFGSIGGSGTAYFGFGADAPIRMLSAPSASGSLDVSAVGIVNVLPRKTLQEMYARQDVSGQIYGAQFKVAATIAGYFNLSFQFNEAIGPSRKYVRDSVALQLGYNPPPASSTGAP